MQWSEAIKEYTAALQSVTITPAYLQKLVGLVDLTSLNDTDTEASIAAFCRKAHTPVGHVAAICVDPAFVRLVASSVAGSPINIATVVNFPEGDMKLEDVLIDINHALSDGANEIDVVFPYHRYLAGETHYIREFIEACKAACGEAVLLKVILETGALIEPAIIADASWVALAAGADFIKTSTGKIAIGVTIEAAATMLLALKQAAPKLNRRVGLKVSGGIKTIDQATQYIQLAEEIMGQGWVCPETFRIGASQLIDEIIK